MAFAEIQSIGLPHEIHADRVVAQMLRQVAETSAPYISGFVERIKASSDGSPKAQRKLAARIIQAGGFEVELMPGKRGRYELSFYSWCCWNDTTDRLIGPGDVPPPKPWIATLFFHLISKGGGSRDLELRYTPTCFITHHCLSRAAQRFGMRTVPQLLITARQIWQAVEDVVDVEGDVKASLKRAALGLGCRWKGFRQR